jgi:hypothetical protein
MKVSNQKIGFVKKPAAKMATGFGDDYLWICLLKQKILNVKSEKNQQPKNLCRINSHMIPTRK